MEFISGISKKEYVSIKELAQGSCDGKTVRMEGMVHAVRDMGDVRFVILRKAEGLVQCVYEVLSMRRQGRHLEGNFD